MAWEVTSPTFGQPLAVALGDATPVVETIRYEDEGEARAAYQEALDRPYMIAVRRMRQAVQIKEV